MQDMLNNLAAYAKKPELYAKGDATIWSDEYVSKGMLQAHLDPSMDAASRRPSFIDKSVEWLARVAPRYAAC